MVLGSTQPLTDMSIRKVKGGRRVRLIILPPSVSRLPRESVGASTSHNPMGLHGLLQRELYLFFLLSIHCPLFWIIIHDVSEVASSSVFMGFDVIKMCYFITISLNF
jgi:hypothetical protein